MRNSKLVVALGAFVAFGLGASQASAATLIADGFSYADGDLTDYLDAALVPGDNVSGSLWDDHSGGGFLPRIVVSNGSALLQNSGSEDAHRDAGVSNGGTAVWYYAAKFTVTDNDLANDLVNEDYFIHLRDGGDFNFPARTYIANPALTAGMFSLGLSAGTGGLVVKTQDIAYGVEHTIVVKFDPTTGEARLWLNQVSEAGASIVDTNAARIGNLADSLSLRQDSISPFVDGSDNTIAVNGVGLATTWQEAFVASMIPEPASLSLLALGGLAMLRRRSA